MSGYFTRLASMVQAPASSASSARTSIAPAPLEQDIEPAATPLASTASHTADSSGRVTPENSARSLIQASAAQSGMPAARSAQSMPASEPAASDLPHLMSAQARSATSEPAPAESTNVSTSVHALRATTAPASHRGTTPSPRKAFAPMSDAQSPLQLSTRHFTPHLAPGADVSVPVRADRMASADLLTSPAARQGAPASPVTTNRPQPSQGFAAPTGGDAWPGTPRSQAMRLEAPMRPTTATAAPRTEIRIGTIALEVRTAAPASIAAAPQPAAVAKPIPASQFSPRRHYLRWS